MDPSRRGPEGDLNDLERRIAGWRPAPGGLDRDRLMFEAGRASARVGRLERIGSAAIACLALALGALLVQERSRRPAGEDAPAVTAHAPAVPPRDPEPVAAPEPDSYLVLTRRMLASRPEGARATAEEAPSFRPGPSAADPEPTLSPLRARGPGGSVDL